MIKKIKQFLRFWFRVNAPESKKYLGAGQYIEHKEEMKAAIKWWKCAPLEERVEFMQKIGAKEHSPYIFDLIYKGVRGCGS